MTRKFSVFDPATGKHTQVTSVEELKALIAQTALDFFNLHTHNRPYNIIDVGDDGSETWLSPDGEVVLSPDQLVAQMEADIENRIRFSKDLISVTKL